ncbi:hypothetical protein KY385_01180 [Candidatus Parcubacteria bacterium]|nr:hypothetical protein [Candidatus Parcubacteria bacterium]
MTPKRLYFLILGLSALIFIALIASVFAGNYLLKQQSEKLSQAKAEAQAIDNQKVSLAQAKNDLEQYAELNEIAKSVVPQDKDQAKTVREINKIAGASGIELSQISFQSSTLGQRAPTSSDTQSKLPAITQVQPVPGINGVYALEITIVSSKDPIPYYKFLEFLEGLENNRRTAHVKSISVSPVAAGANVTFLLKLNAYLKP